MRAIRPWAGMPRRTDVRLTLSLQHGGTIGATALADSQHGRSARESDQDEIARYPLPGRPGGHALGLARLITTRRDRGLAGRGTFPREGRASSRRPGLPALHAEHREVERPDGTDRDEDNVRGSLGSARRELIEEPSLAWISAFPHTSRPSPASVTCQCMATFEWCAMFRALTLFGHEPDHVAFPRRMTSRQVHHATAGSRIGLRPSPRAKHANRAPGGLPSSHQRCHNPPCAGRGGSRPLLRSRSSAVASPSTSAGRFPRRTCPRSWLARPTRPRSSA
jgi:hypothetical protein